MQKKVNGGFAGHTTIRDLGIDSGDPQLGPGLWIESVSNILLQRVLIYGFSAGIAGSAEASHVTIDSCIIDGSIGHVWLGSGCNDWIIRDCNCREAGEISIAAVHSVANLLIQNCNLEKNPVAVLVGESTSNVLIENCRFEGSPVAVQIDASATSTRIVANQFDVSNNLLPMITAMDTPMAGETQIGFNGSYYALKRDLEALVARKI